MGFMLGLKAFVAAVSSCGDKFGIFGAGGNTGNSTTIFGTKEGNSGNVGGCGRVGMSGIFIGIVSPIIFCKLFKREVIAACDRLLSQFTPGIAMVGG